MNEQEKALMESINQVYRGILGLGLRVNQSELAHAIHTLQMFVMMSYLKRIEPENWNDWYC